MAHGACTTTSRACVFLSFQPSASLSGGVVYLMTTTRQVNKRGEDGDGDGHGPGSSACRSAACARRRGSVTAAAAGGGGGITCPAVEVNED